MKLKTQKKLAANVFKASGKRVVFNPERLEDIKEAITKTDIRGLIADKAIFVKQKKGVSKVRVRKTATQRKKGLRKGPSTRKGKKTTRTNNKSTWINKVRSQRNFLKLLREKKLITKETYSNLYLKVKGNFFRSKRHIQIHLDDHKLIEKEKNQTNLKNEQKNKIKL